MSLDVDEREWQEMTLNIEELQEANLRDERQEMTPKRDREVPDNQRKCFHTPNIH